MKHTCRAPAMLRAATARAARGLAARSRGPTPRAPIHAPPAGVATRALSGKAPSESATRSIAGDNTREYLVKVPAASMEANLDGDQSNLRSRLLTLTSVGVAIYLGFYIFPLVGASPAPSPRARATRSIPSRRPPLTPPRLPHPLVASGGGTASSAVRMCKSKDALFQRAGISRLRTVMRAGGASHLSGAVDLGAGEALLALILAAPAASSAANKKHKHRGGAIEPARGASDAAPSRAETAREVAREALDAMEELAAADATAAAMAKRRGVIDATRDSSQDASLDGETRARLRKIHARLVAAAAKDEGR